MTRDDTSWHENARDVPAGHVSAPTDLEPSATTIRGDYGLGRQVRGHAASAEEERSSSGATTLAGPLP